MKLMSKPALLIAATLMAAAGATGAQEVCHDWDGDGEVAGWACGEAADCMDLSWWRRPGAEETCDGQDGDCDGTLDEQCDRWCDFPTLFPQLQVIGMDGVPYGDSPHAALTDDGFYFIGTEQEGPYPYPTSVHGLGLDRHGRRLGPQSPLDGQVQDEPHEWFPGIVAAGAGALAVWEHKQDPEDNDSWHLMARVLDRLGHPVAPALDISGPLGVSFENGPAAALWDGDRFVVFWHPFETSSRSNELYMSVIGRDGTPAEPLTRLVTDNVDGKRSHLHPIRAVWTGSHYLVATFVGGPIGEPNLFTIMVDRDGMRTGGEALSYEADEDIQLVRASDRVALIWVGGSAWSERVYVH